MTGARRPLAKIHGRCLGLALPHAVNTPSAADTSNPCSAQANYSSAAARAGDGTGPRGTGNSTCLGQTGVDKGKGGGAAFDNRTVRLGSALTKRVHDDGPLLQPAKPRRTLSVPAVSRRVAQQAQRGVRGTPFAVAPRQEGNYSK